jgi:hypothetical protein
MQDNPTPVEILTAVARFLRDVVMPEARPHTAFQARVAANAVDLVGRQITLAPESDGTELTRLRILLGHDTTLEQGSTALAEQISDGVVNMSTPGLMAHLLDTTLAKLAVDQPNYSGYRAALASAPAAKEQ